MKMKANSIALVVIMLIMLAAAAISISFKNLDASLTPLLLSITIFVLAGVELVRDTRKNKKTVMGEGEGERIEFALKKEELARLGSALGWIGGFAVGTSIFGFYLAIPLFAVIYMKLRGRSLVLATVFAVALTVFFYVVFEIGLRSRLYRGLLFTS